jgi:hypothetical protein
MHRSCFLTIFTAALATSAAVAKPCIMVRNADEGYTCMKFSMAEQKKAQKLGVQLGSPYKETQAQLVRSGWSLDQDWIVDNPKEAKQGRPACGQGLDAVCSISLRKGSLKIEPIFSGTSEEMPLIGIDGEL